MNGTLMQEPMTAATEWKTNPECRSCQPCSCRCKNYAYPQFSVPTYKYWNTNIPDERFKKVLEIQWKWFFIWNEFRAKIGIVQEEKISKIVQRLF